MKHRHLYERSKNKYEENEMQYKGFQYDCLFSTADVINNDWNKMPSYRVLGTKECGAFALTGGNVCFNYGFINTFP
jgi:hypothetical protein